jgi:hypothetical protein
MVYPIWPQRNQQPYRANMYRNPRQGMGTVVRGSKTQTRNWQPALMKGVDGVSKTLGNVQQVLDVVQSTTPIIQQYGPMVKNIPAMYRMLKAFKDTDTESAGTEAEINNHDAEPSKKMLPMNKQENTNTSGESTPKLFF